MTLPSRVVIFFPKTGRPYDGLAYSVPIPLTLPSALLSRMVLSNSDLSDGFHGHQKTQSAGTIKMR